METRGIHVNDLVLQMEKMLRRLIGEDIELVTIAAAASDAVTADPGRMEQVVMNLVVNARDAMPNGGKLTIETGTIHLNESFSAGQLGVSPGPYVTISVIDTGTGMDQETQSHLFEPFFTTKNPGRGTGPRSGDGIRNHSPEWRSNRDTERIWAKDCRPHLSAAL